MPKPVLSDSLFNADDVATAILSQANLSVTNQDFGVVDQSSLFSMSSDLTVFGKRAFSFNGFMFVQMLLRDNNGISHGDILGTITNTDYAPTDRFEFPTISNEGDTAYRIDFHTNGEIKVDTPDNQGSTNYHVCINGWYRFT